jgi:hypothetical protein
MKKTISVNIFFFLKATVVLSSIFSGCSPCGTFQDGWVASFSAGLFLTMREAKRL